MTWKGVLSLLMIAGFVVLTIWLQNRYQTGLHDLVAQYGLLAIFVIGVVTNAPVIAPVTSISLVALVLNIGAQHNLVIAVGLYAVGATIGESAAYFTGVVGKNLSHLEGSRTYSWLRKKLTRRWMFPVLLAGAASPAPFDLISIMVGGVRYPYRWFLLATFAGRCVKYWVLLHYGGQLCQSFGELPAISFVC